MKSENSLNLCLRIGDTGINGYLTVWYCTTYNNNQTQYNYWTFLYSISVIVDE